MSKKLVKAITSAKKEKAEVRLNIRLKKNGQFSSVSGRVSEVKVNSDGGLYAVVKPSKGRKAFQSVPLENVLAVVRDGEVIRK